MIKRFAGINISSSNPKALTAFYLNLGIPVLTENPEKDNYDGVELGFDGRKSILWIWNKERWGMVNDGPVTLVFNCDDIEQTYRELTERGIACDAPFIAIWGGKEIKLTDPEGNHIIIME